VITIKNTNLDKDLSITYFDIIPWFVSIYMNSFKIENTKIKDYHNDGKYKLNLIYKINFI